MARFWPLAANARALVTLVKELTLIVDKYWLLFTFMVPTWVSSIPDKSVRPVLEM